MLILHEENTEFREIFLDGREPIEDAEPRWMGYSTAQLGRRRACRGARAGSTTAIGSTYGPPDSDKMRLTERYRRRDAGHLEIEVTIDDPGAYTRPITATHTFTLMPDESLLEYFCTENEKTPSTTDSRTAPPLTGRRVACPPPFRHNDSLAGTP